MLSNVLARDFAFLQEAGLPEIEKVLRSDPVSPRLARYASFAARSRGRRYFEEPSAERTPFARDRDRIVHASAFRRLAHKTQVFVYDEGDHYRNRLTHSLEVAQIGRSIASLFQLDEDLTEAICLAHDLGHTPFGHAGERALGRVLKGFGGFDHNIQTLRIVTKLEIRYPAFDGLNLSWECLEGLVKHNGPLLGDGDEVVGACQGQSLPQALCDMDAELDFGLQEQAGLEAQVAALADDIAYNNHDIDDGLRAGLFALDDLEQVPLAWRLIEEVRRDWPGIGERRLICELNRRLISEMIRDVVAESSRRLEALAPADASEVRAAGAPMIAFSSEFDRRMQELRDFLYARVYRHDEVMSVMGNAERIVEGLAEHYINHPRDLPREWSCNSTRVNINECAGKVRDYIAGMTDRYTVKLHRSLFDVTPKLR